MTSIGYEAFYCCTNLKTVINYSALDIQRGSYDNGYVACYADRVIDVDKVIDGCAFKTKDGVHYLTGYMGNDTELTLPADYEGESYKIGERAFYGCSNITAITILENVTSIGNEAFNGCSSLKELTLSKELKKIESKAFYGCTALEKVTTYATRPPTATDVDVFSDAAYENATLYVPQGCIDKYQVMTGWSGFYTIEEVSNKVEGAHSQSVKVREHEGTLRITGAAEGEAISVYTTGGTLVANETAQDSETSLTLATDQVYIVTVGDKVVKIGM